MLARKTVLDRIEIDQNGNIGMRIGLLIVDGEKEIDRKAHRVVIHPGDNIDEKIGDVNKHLEKDGCAALAKPKTLDQIVGIVHTPEAISAHRKRISGINS